MSKFGLDYLFYKPPQVQQAEQSQNRSAEQVEPSTALLRRNIASILKTLKDKGQDECTLNDMVDALSVNRDILGLAVGRMAELGLLRVVPEKYGNHSVHLTNAGEEYLNDPVTTWR